MTSNAAMTSTDRQTADWRLAVDIGGTFTDVVFLEANSGRVVVEKLLTSPSDPLVAVKTGIQSVLQKTAVLPSDIFSPVVHATTLVTNALIEGRTAKAGLVTTSGFADTLLIRDEHRYDMYDLQIEFAAPPIPRERTVEIAERTLATGQVQQSPSTQDLELLANELQDMELEAVAVCLLHAYANPANEQLCAEFLADALGLPVCISSDISPQIREFPRMVTTAANAACMPVIGPYLHDFEQWLSGEGFKGAPLLMLSNGGVVSAQEAAAAPVRLVESGPAAGAHSGAWFAKRMGERRLLCFDMGGTTAKSCLLNDFSPDLTTTLEVARIYRFKHGSGLPLTIPSVDLVEIGAGGGSIAHTDNLGLLKVGPESSGADPGPASYSLGGTDPTVTDADVLLGLLDPGAFLGGDMPLDSELAKRAVEKLSSELSLTTTDVAAGIHEVVNQNMAAAARMHAVEQGTDLRGTPLIAFGGAGPVHACGVAELLESPKVIFPQNASVLSSFGALIAPVQFDLARSMPALVGEVDLSQRDEMLADMRQRGHEVLVSSGVAPEKVRFRYGVDMRYVGQGNEFTVWVGDGDQWPATDEEIVAAFEDSYRKIYGLTIPDLNMEIVTWRLRAWADPDIVEPPLLERQPDYQPKPTHQRQVTFQRGAEPIETPIFKRHSLSPGAQLVGPAIVEERETTIVLRPNWQAEVAEDGSIIAINLHPNHP